MTPPNQPYTLTFESLVYLSDLYNTYLKETAARRGVDLCDPASQMAASNDFFYDEMHFTEQGSDRIAELLVPCVAEALKNRTAG
jgi:lysophospholipase L1-like esterase